MYLYMYLDCDIIGLAIAIEGQGLKPKSHPLRNMHGGTWEKTLKICM